MIQFDQFHISVVFLCGRIFGLYKLIMPENNVIVETAKCVWVSNTKENLLIGINQNLSKILWKDF